MAKPPPRQPPILNEDLLIEIILRIRCPADLTRASAACHAFRRIITDPTFLRRYRSHHKPLLLGFFRSYPSMGFHPVEAPHPNAPAARAVANISFDYFPPAKLDHWRRYIVDVRDGRVLFKYRDMVPYFAVCDPLFGRYLVLPPVPNKGVRLNLEAVDGAFAPCTDKKDDTSFRVICAMIYETECVAFIFDSGCGSWTFRTSSTWDCLHLTNCPPGLSHRSYAHGCLYWKVDGINNSLLKLDITRMKLSTVVLPPDHDQLREVLVVQAGEGILGLFSYTHGTKVLNYYHYNGQIDDEWQMKNAMIPVPDPDHQYLRIFEACEGYIFLATHLKHHGQKCYYYMLDIKTLKFERVIQMSPVYLLGSPYFGFPPSISPRLI